MATTKIITQAEAFKLISWLESHNKQLFADVAITMASLCLRVGDTVNLKFSQFKEGNTLEVLESKTGKKKENFILDGFSDRDDFGCHLPNDLFFGPERAVDLSRDYGEEDKRAARSNLALFAGRKV